MGKYSIILPVRNGGEYVKECVQSILDQTLPDFDLIVLDNCSTDDTLSWLQSLSDRRIRIYPSEKSLSIEENWGRITGVQKNEFMTMIGHDDLLDKDYLATMDALIRKHPQASLYQAHYRYIDEKGRFMRHCSPIHEIQYVHEFLACQFLHTMDSTGTGYMMRSADYDEAGGIPPYPNLIFADYELWVRLTHKSYRATNLQECFSYRLHNSISRTTNGDQYQQSFGRYMLFLKDFKQKDARIEEVVRRYAKNFLLYFCESLSHRILKTPINKRNIKVSEFIAKCNDYAAGLIPGQDFQPLNKFRIWIAKQLDGSMLGRGLFKIYKLFF